MGGSFKSYCCPECAKMLRLASERAADAQRSGVTFSDPMQRQEIWNLLNSELRPPRQTCSANHEAAGAAAGAYWRSQSRNASPPTAPAR